MALQTEYNCIITSLHSGLKVITLNRPHKKNAFNFQMYQEIEQALQEASKDDRVIITVLTGAGEYYSSGNDINNYGSFGVDDLDASVRKATSDLERFIKTLIDFPKILIAVVNGPAIGVAVTTLGLCDIVYASDKATFSTPFTSLGLSPEGCSSYTFPQIMGTSLASEVLYLGRKLNAHEAKACGLVSQVYPHDAFSELWTKLEKMCEFSQSSLLSSKQLVRRWNLDHLHAACRNECRQLEECFKSEDCINAVLNFLQRRSKL